MKSHESRLYTLDEVAARLSICRRSLERLIAAGEFPSPVKLGRSSRVTDEDVQAYLEKLVSKRSAE